MMLTWSQTGIQRRGQDDVAPNRLAIIIIIIIIWLVHIDLYGVANQLMLAWGMWLDRMLVVVEPVAMNGYNML